MIHTITDLLNPWSVLTATAGLIAFHIGLFTLVGRERKSPYVINTVFPVFLLCLIVATLTLAAILVPTIAYRPLLNVSIAILVLAFSLSVVVVYRTAVRFIYFVDSLHAKHWPGVRHFRRWKEFRGPKPSYEHHSLPVGNELKEKVLQVLTKYVGPISEQERNADLEAISLRVPNQRVANALLADLSREFLENDSFVQYVCASRHPIEFVEHFHEQVRDNPKKWNEWAAGLIVIDAYSPHFAFIDSIYQSKDRQIDALDVRRVTSKMTFAGIHTASSSAFKLFKSTSGSKRKPTLVIYEGTYALSDLESPEQYRIFVRHVIPSERMWSGMLTIFLETALSTYDWEILSSYSSIARAIAAPEAVKESTKEAKTGRKSG